MKDDFQALQMESLELQFTKEELVDKVANLELDRERASHALKLAEQEIEKERVEREAGLLEKCVNMLKRYGVSAAIFDDSLGS